MQEKGKNDMAKFKIESQYKPSGDQPAAIKGICSALNDGVDAVTLLGVTGSGKTFTMANVIAQLNRPALNEPGGLRLLKIQFIRISISNEGLLPDFSGRQLDLQHHPQLQTL